MYLINNNPFVDFEPHIDLSFLEQHLPYLNYSVVKSSVLARPSWYYSASFLEPNKVGLADVLPSYTNDKLQDYEFLQDLKDCDQLGSWLRYQEDISYGQQSISIYYTLEYLKKHLQDQRVGTQAVEYFDLFFKWLESQCIFNEFGRVVIFPNEPYTKTPIHQDYPDGMTRKDEFIWINLDRRKKFFVYDEATNEKHYVNSRICTFDNASYHGCDNVEFATWSLRVDGVFADEFLHKTGLYNHYRKS